MANKENHRRFGNIRKRESGRYQIRYPAPDGRMRTGTDTYERKSDAERALSLIEAQIIKGEWNDPERGKVKLRDYAETWIAQRPGLRPRTVDLYRWLLKKHITPHLGSVPIAKISTSAVRQWRADLLDNGVSVSMAAKAYRLLRAVLMTAADDRVIPQNPCRIRGAGDEHAQERPVLTVSQVFELADRVGLRPIGNVRKIKDGAYRLRFQRHGAMRTHPEIFHARAAAERALWKMAMDGKADSTQDRRFRAMVLLATFASLRWGEVSALRRMDVDLKARTVRVRVAFVERSASGLVLGPPKSKAGRRTVGIPQSIVPVLQEHMNTYVQDEPGALMFPAAKGGPIRRSGFNTRTQWVDVVSEMGLPGLHFHDLRHTGNMLAAESGAGLKDLMARMGHDNVRAAMIYQHAVRGADEAITNAIDRQLEARDDDDDEGTAGALVPAG
ncbi:tyrosine-type recombinase/integrase [Nonomuraea gerenzanensis]|uniref:Phage integrase n=1 Tax=Nonomuraea gerenzanensis TaxID=93944 RepID=A0A1M4DZ16_9ACTN|nr:site-specific integrase [Nonomuraea gerenzanensis]UBU14089.1 site-specific integrase [Nonomuraea gerenzanensis]SBO91780.1 phage integrase [Nonomuraea gerenzanensis]